jgi:hypothetical protein
VFGYRGNPECRGRFFSVSWAIGCVGDPGKVDFGCPGDFENIGFLDFFEKNEKFRAAEIDFSGMSGGSKWFHRIRHAKKCQKPKTRVSIDFWGEVGWEGRAKTAEKSKKSKFRASEIDFSGISGAPRWYHRIQHQILHLTRKRWVSATFLVAALGRFSEKIAKLPILKSGGQKLAVRTGLGRVIKNPSLRRERACRVTLFTKLVCQKLDCFWEGGSMTTRWEEGVSYPPP